MMHFLLVIAALSLIISANSFVRSIPSKFTTTSKSKRTALKAGLNDIITKQKTHAIIATATAATAEVVKPTMGNIVAKGLGYVIGVGSLAVYLPIVISLFKKKSADGFSAATWMYNLIGITLAVVYPLKKGFPTSTYVELLLLVAQTTGILGKEHSYLATSGTLFLEYELINVTYVS
jgi:hypothetical protein